jgi:hypothetical protein
MKSEEFVQLMKAHSGETMMLWKRMYTRDMVELIVNSLCNNIYCGRGKGIVVQQW